MARHTLRLTLELDVYDELALREAAFHAGIRPITESPAIAETASETVGASLGQLFMHGPGAVALQGLAEHIPGAALVSTGVEPVT